MRDYKDLKSAEVEELEKKERNYNTDIKCTCGGHMVIRINKNNNNQFMNSSKHRRRETPVCTLFPNNSS